MITSFNRRIPTLTSLLGNRDLISLPKSHCQRVCFSVTTLEALWYEVLKETVFKNN